MVFEVDAQPLWVWLRVESAPNGRSGWISDWSDDTDQGCCAFAGDYGDFRGFDRRFRSRTPPAQAITGSSILTRAQSWVDARVPYSQQAYYSNQYGRYRTDCSGYVSMAWGLGTSLNTSTLPSVATRIGKDDLQAGDMLLNNRAANPDHQHVVLFDQWADAGHTKYWGYEQAFSPGYTVRRVIPYPYDAKYDPGNYLPYRYNGYEPPNAARDGDGTPDASDRCPDQAGPSNTQGCPDRDGDAVADLDDKCSEPGEAAEQGCQAEVGYVIDVNGDRRADLIHRWSTGVNTWLSKGDGSYDIKGQQAQAGYGYGEGTWMTGDVNADGRTDLVHRWNVGVNTWLSKGDGSYDIKGQQAQAGYGYNDGVWPSSSASLGLLEPAPQAPPGGSPSPNPGNGTGALPSNRPAGSVTRVRTKRVNSRWVRVSWKAAPAADHYRARISSPKTKRTRWATVKVAHVRVHLRRGQHVVLALQAVGSGGAGSVTRWRL